ncbi:hypothetical protein Tco_1228390 [Tanacetum coccineum]
MAVAAPQPVKVVPALAPSGPMARISVMVVPSGQFKNKASKLKPIESHSDAIQTGANPDRYGDELGQIQTDADLDGCRFRQTEQQIQAAADSNSSTFRPRIQQIQIQADKSGTKQSHMHDQTISDIVRGQTR